MLFRGKVHGVREVVADIHRHPDIRRAQTPWIVVLCP